MPPTVIQKKSATKLHQKKTKSSDNSNELDEWKKAKQLLKPKGQLDLGDLELKEIIGKQLTSNNSQIPDSIVEFSYAQKQFVPLPPPDNLVKVYEAQGTVLHKDSEEARIQLIDQGIDPSSLQSSENIIEEAEEFSTSEVLQEEDNQEKDEEPKDEDEEGIEKKEDEKPEHDEEEEGEGEGEGEAETNVEAPKPAAKGGKPRKLTNQFNFCERAALTYNNPTRPQETQTIPPPMANFSANVLQWIIYDAYQEDYEAQQLEKEIEREKREQNKMSVGKPQVTQKKGIGKTEESEIVQGRILECWKVMERMINQNTYDDIAKDYRYWDDPSDEFRDEEGTLLPLWKFTYDKTKKNTVTDISWNPYYYDLYSVCFGFLEYMKPIQEGAVCLFTLKNPSFPDYICLTDSGVMCADTHPKYPYMVVIGLYDGSVQVFNVHATCKEPAFRSNNVNNKHRGIVWEVKWAPDLPDGELNFFSVGSDGKVNNWVLMQNELSVTTIITLYLERDSVPGPDGTLLRLKSSACCVKIHPKKPLIYLIGTEEGLIYKCSTAYSSMYLLTYHAHNMPVYRIDFNNYNTDIFASCSADWRIKIWEDNRQEPLFVFDVGDRVGDVKWAPYSSTVFAAVTSEGKVCVFDLNVNKYKPICVQAIVSKRRNKISRISFNPKLPIIIVGDDKGCITTLKLSPNLRIPCKAPKKQQHLDQWTLQCMKLEKLLSLVREPVTLSLPDDTAGSEES